MNDRKSHLSAAIYGVVHEDEEDGSCYDFEVPPVPGGWSSMHEATMEVDGELLPCTVTVSVTLK